MLTILEWYAEDTKFCKEDLQLAGLAVESNDADRLERFKKYRQFIFERLTNHVEEMREKLFKWDPKEPDAK